MKTRACDVVTEDGEPEKKVDSGIGDVVVPKRNRFRWFNMKTGKQTSLNTLAHLTTPTKKSGYRSLCSSNRTLTSRVTHKIRYKWDKCTVTPCIAVRDGKHHNWRAKWKIFKRIVHVADTNNGACGGEEERDDCDEDDLEKRTSSKDSEEQQSLWIRL